MILTGTFVRVIDEKQRVAIPKHVREAFDGQQAKGVYLAPGTDGSLAIYPSETFVRLADRLASASPAGQDVRAFSRLFYSRAEYVELDSQGRIRIPQPLADGASLTKDVVLLGVQNHLELWDKGRWEQYLALTAPRYDEIAEGAFPSNPPRPAS